MKVYSLLFITILLATCLPTDGQNTTQTPNETNALISTEAPNPPETPNPTHATVEEKPPSPDTGGDITTSATSTDEPAENGNPWDFMCPLGAVYSELTSECITTVVHRECAIGTVFAPHIGKCVNMSQLHPPSSDESCPPGYVHNTEFNVCITEPLVKPKPLVKCPPGSYYNCDLKQCVPLLPKCPAGSFYDPRVNKCTAPVRSKVSCPLGASFDMNLGVCRQCPLGSAFDQDLGKCSGGVAFSAEPYCPENSSYVPALSLCTADAEVLPPPPPECHAGTFFHPKIGKCVMAPMLRKSAESPCPRHTTYNPTTARCMAMPEQVPSRLPKICPAGCNSHDESNKCICPAIRPPERPPVCTEGAVFDFTYNMCHMPAKVEYKKPETKCQEGFSYNPLFRKCESLAPPDPACPEQSLFDPLLLNCLAEPEPYHVLSDPVCPSGFHLNETLDKCISLVAPQCPQGSTFDQDLAQCIAEVMRWKIPRVRCAPGFFYQSDIDRCSLETAPQNICPPGSEFNGLLMKCLLDGTYIPGEELYHCAGNFKYDPNLRLCTSSNYTVLPPLPNKCVGDYELSPSGETCVSKYDIHGKKIPACPARYTLDKAGSTCISTERVLPPKPTVHCPPGTKLHSPLNKCVTDSIIFHPAPPPKCPMPGFSFSVKLAKCVSNQVIRPPPVCNNTEFTYDSDSNMCVADEKIKPVQCPKNFIYNPHSLHCERIYTPSPTPVPYSPHNQFMCPAGFKLNTTSGTCFADNSAPCDEAHTHPPLVPCPVGFVYDPVGGKCHVPEARRVIDAEPTAESIPTSSASPVQPTSSENPAEEEIIELTKLAPRIFHSVVHPLFGLEPIGTDTRRTLAQDDTPVERSGGAHAVVTISRYLYSQFRRSNSNKDHREEVIAKPYLRTTVRQLSDLQKKQKM